jgi:hypothetical protein
MPNLHLRRPPHSLYPDDELPPPVTPTVYTQLLNNQSYKFTAEGFRSKLCRMIAVLHLPLSLVESFEFRDLMLYCCPHLRGNDTLPKSSTTVRAWLLEMFIASQVILVKLLFESNCQVHVSFDLWSSPNYYSMLGIVCHFIDRDFKARTVLLGMKRLLGPHSGANMAELLIKVIKLYKLEKVLGFCVLDNARDNDTSLRSVQAYLLTQGIIWDGDAHRLRCFGHVVSLVVNAFTANKPLHSLKVRRPKGSPKVKWIRPEDAISKLHHIIVFIMATSQRIEAFMEINNQVDDEVLHPVRENDTRWFSTLLMLLRAIILKNSIDLFVARHQTLAKDENNLQGYTLSSDDWHYCTEIIAFMNPLYLLVKELEGKSVSGIYPTRLECYILVNEVLTEDILGLHGYVGDVLPAYNYMREHMKEQLEFFNPNPNADDLDDDFQRSIIQINIRNATEKLMKYYKLLQLQPIYYVAVVLVPWQKWAYFEDQLDEEHMTASELRTVKKAIQRLWDDKYAIIQTETPDPQPKVSSSDPKLASKKKPSLLKEHMKRKNKDRQPREALKDEYLRYCQLDVEEEDEKITPLDWWKAHAKEFPRLAQWARDIFSIPGMSAEVERLFSSTKLMLPAARNNLKEDIIEAAECIRSWTLSRMILTDYFEYLPENLRIKEQIRMENMLKRRGKEILEEMVEKLD